MGECLICGDFNARTNCEIDYCVENTKLDELMDGDDTQINDVTDIPIPRNNMDSSSVDDHGNKLFNLSRVA